MGDAAPIYKTGLIHMPGKPAPKLANYLKAPLLAPPTICYRANGVPYRLYGNDLHGNCVIASEFNAMLARSFIALGNPIVADDDACLGVYYSLTDGVDSGLQMEQGLHWAAKNGISIRDGQVERQVSAELVPGDLDGLKRAIATFGVVNWGVNLPKSAQGADKWDVTSAGLTGDGEPGSWSPHDTLLVGFDHNTLYGVAWNQVVEVSEEFWRAYSLRNFATFSPGEWLSPAGLSPDNLDMAALERDWAAFNAQPVISPMAEASAGGTATLS